MNYRMSAILCLIVVAASGAYAAAPVAQRFEPTWSSVDSRPTPTWWTDAKFGIFIHWGVYSVPAFAPKGEYAEWYWERLGRPGNPDPSSNDAKIRQETRAFHERVYGKDFQYADFAPRFTAEMFDADQWADILRRSGAKYVVLVSKHHDGFALWPSREADASWGRPWNAVEVGPRRDLVGELSAAVRRQQPRDGFLLLAVRVVQPAVAVRKPGCLRRAAHVSAVQGPGDALLAVDHFCRRRMGAALGEMARARIAGLAVQRQPGRAEGGRQ